ncbi:MAG: hypothetical protein JWP94_512 [Mucilaginibacter sp.]|nr:hypothetical protein [Mucilaginibacter sp.]
MGIDIILDLQNCYPLTVRKNKKSYRFQALLENGENKQLFVLVDDNPHRDLPDVYNLAYGPAGNSESDTEKIKDKDTIGLDDVSKVFSTILSCGLTFLESCPGTFLGIDGSDHKRSCLFHRVVHNNFDYLDQYFQIYGVKFYARLLRFNGRAVEGSSEYLIDPCDMKTEPVRIRKNNRVDTDNLYNYFIFKLK